MTILQNMMKVISPWHAKAYVDGCPIFHQPFSVEVYVLVALQAALTVIGNFTMCLAAYRIYKSSRESSENI
ncbi:transmembrane protein, putative [Medicago truncatula]|uniref:Transmembrane protein, putative n=1 Tax=Medicago truncatula TaxID=3880 RepID=A0A072UCE6_MEDTR|nr:transmembrane protein, putative [Medicago truncatula]